jgi:hypothetical protein
MTTSIVGKKHILKMRFKRTSTTLMVMKDKTTVTPQPSLRWSKLQVTVSITRMVTGTRMSQKVCGVQHRPKILSSPSPYPKHEEKNKLPLNNKPTKARPPSITSLFMIQITGRRTLSSTGPLARLPLIALSTELQSLLLHCRSEKRPMSMPHLALSPVKRGANIPRITIPTRRMPQPQRRLSLLQAVETVVNLAAEEELREKPPREEREVQKWQHRHHRCSLHQPQLHHHSQPQLTTCLGLSQACSQHHQGHPQRGSASWPRSFVNRSR